MDEIKNKITLIEQNLPHETAELLCLNCHKRWIGVYPKKLLLKDMECKCGCTGMIIKTGQSLPEEGDAYEK